MDHVEDAPCRVRVVHRVRKVPYREFARLRERTPGPPPGGRMATMRSAAAMSSGVICVRSFSEMSMPRSSMYGNECLELPFIFAVAGLFRAISSSTRKPLLHTSCLGEPLKVSFRHLAAPNVGLANEHNEHTAAPGVELGGPEHCNLWEQPGCPTPRQMPVRSRPSPECRQAHRPPAPLPCATLPGGRAPSRCPMAVPAGTQSEGSRSSDR